ncbi:MAG: hypothetical protein CME70_09285 [Halobacteriovorax sp.]|nr:hypothetical protein [Halobacteriovorax sp.]
MRSIFLFSLFFFLLNSNLQAALYGYCLGDGESLRAAKFHLSKVLAPKDQIHIRSSVGCLEIVGGAERFELYDRFLRAKFRVIRTYKDQDTGSRISQIPRGMCRIFVTKIGKNKKVTDKVKIGKSGNLSRSEAKGISKSTSNLILSYGKRGSLTVNEQRVGITCKKAGAGYQLEFDLENKDSGISSNAFVTPGQELNIGGIVNDLNNKRRTVSLNNGLEYEKEKGKEFFDYFLKVK